MKITLDYGKRGLSATIPDGNVLGVYHPHDEPAIDDPSEGIRKKLLAPLGTPGFRDLCRGKRTACIVVSDRTRPVPNAIILPPLLDQLESLRIRTTILIACGMHSPTVGADLGSLLGQEILERCDVVNHRGEDEASQMRIGTSSNGVELYINRRYVEADVRILTGFIEPHFMAGFSGGRKSVCPGISGARTMRYAHSPQLMEAPESAPGVIEGNPFHAFSLEVAQKAGVDIIVNVTLNRAKEITGIFAGDLVAAHAEGVAFCRRQATIGLPGAAEIVVTSNGGDPLDQDLYQTVKGMVSALPAVKKGGTIIIVSECRAGIGSDHFKDMLFEMADQESFLEMVRRPGFFRIDQWEVEELIKALRKARIMVYSTGISSADLERCHVEPIQSVEEGIARCLEVYGDTAKIAVIPAGPYVIPYLAGDLFLPSPET